MKTDALSIAGLALASSLLLGCDNPAKPEPQTPASSPSPSGSTRPVPADAPSPPAPAPTGNAADAAPAGPKPSAAQVSSFAKASNAFAFDLHPRMGKGNVAYSSASISTALAMTWGGAVGPTSDEMRKVLHLDGKVDDVLASAGTIAADLQAPGPVALSIANRLFGEKTFAFEKAFLDGTAKHFGAPLEPVDFKGASEAARARINGWVAERTKDRIQDLVPPRGVDAETRLALVNAVHFLGDWDEPFNKTATADLPFSILGKEEKPVPTMRKTESFRVAEVDGARVVELPYVGGRFAMVIAMPAKVDGLPALEASMDLGRYERWVKALAHERVFLSLPKFEVNPAGSTPLKQVLVGMGMKLAFDREQADFTKIANPPSRADRLVIGEVFHKAFVKVDEKGTEAAAATAVVMPRAGGAPSQPKAFAVDRPFLFFLRDVQSGLILFTGRVVDPSKKG